MARCGAHDRITIASGCDSGCWIDRVMAASASPWSACICGHLMMFHDVEDMDGTNPLCCVEPCQGKCAYKPAQTAVTQGDTGQS